MIYMVYVPVFFASVSIFLVLVFIVVIVVALMQLYNVAIIVKIVLDHLLQTHTSLIPWCEKQIENLFIPFHFQ